MKKKILLIEDDAFIARAYKIGLEQAGFEVELAGDGEQGLAAMRADGHVLVLLDIILPKMNGFELLELLKKEQDVLKTPVIILSNLGQQTDIERAKSLGAIDYFVKANISMDEMIEKINQHLGA